MNDILLAQVLNLPSGTGDTPVDIEGPLSGEGTLGSDVSIGDLVTAAIPFIYAFAGLALLLMLMFGGFKILTSSGDPKKMDVGKQQITYAIVGFVIIFVAYWIVQAFGIIFGIPELGEIFG